LLNDKVPYRPNKKSPVSPGFFVSGFRLPVPGQTVFTPGTSALVAVTVESRAETVEVSLLLLDGADHVCLGHAARLDATFFCDAADSLDVHGVPYLFLNR
jgi:hypothetical protein